MTNDNDSLFIDPALLIQAEQLCRQRLQKDPHNRSMLRSLAEVYRKLGRLGDAADVYARLFGLDPADPEAAYLNAVFAGRGWPLAPRGIRAAPFVLLKDFLAPEFHESLIPYLTSVQARFVPMLNGKGEYQPQHRQALDLPGKWEGKHRFRNCLAEILPHVVPRLFLPPVTLGQIEVCVRAYQDGNFFKIHQDSSASACYAGRVINFVYYFHRLPRPYTGGELLLFDSDTETDTYTTARFTRVVPEDNLLIIFPCNFFHSVAPIRCPSQEFADSRFVINGHVHTRIMTISAVESAAEN